MQFFQLDFGPGYFVEFFRRMRLPEELPREAPAPVKISVCTTCMNRLDDLQSTLPKNLENNAGFENAEFVLLDYNSCDGLGEWVRAELWPYIQSGRLIYYRTSDPIYFQPNHSRNVSFRLATGDLVVNVDADNFMHEGFLSRLSQCAAVAPSKLLIVPANFLAPDSHRLLLRGRFAVYRQDIHELGGFDEDLDEGFSHDDVSFVLRAILRKFKIVRFEALYTEGRIFTSDQKRVSFVQTRDFSAGKQRNEDITKFKLSIGRTTVNQGRHWGKATVIKNFKERIDV